MDIENKNYSGVNELVELPDSESGFNGGSSPSARAKPGIKGYGNWECCCCKKVFETRKLLLDHKRSSIKCHQFSLEEGRKKTNAALKGRKYPGRKLTDEHKQKIKEAAKNRASYWFYSNKNPILYKRKQDGKEIKLDSKWELEVVKRLDELNIKWFRPKIKFNYLTSNGETHLYNPDFFIPEYRCFLEIKSPWVEQLQNVNGKIDYIKNHYPFIIWLESLDECKTFILQDKCYNSIPLEEEENEELILKIKNDLKEKSKLQEKKIKQRSEASLELENYRREILNKAIVNGDIDFSKYGWVNEVAKLFGISPNKINIYIKKRLPDLYDKFYHRKS